MMNLLKYSVILLLLVLSLAPVPALAELAGVVAPTPADALTILTMLGLGHYAASIIAVVGLVAFVVGHLMAWGWIPAPAAKATGAWPMIYTVLNWLVANYGKTANALPMATPVPGPANAPPGVLMVLLLGTALALSACSDNLTQIGAPATQQGLETAAGSLATVAAQNSTTVAAALQKGALVCGKIGSVPGQLALDGLEIAANAAGLPVSVTNAAATTVADTCAAIGLVPGPLPAAAVPANVPVVPVPTTALPAAV
jgi:hypothetical protein